jgi:hypothetical protein
MTDLPEGDCDISPWELDSQMEAEEFRVFREEHPKGCLTCRGTGTVSWQEDLGPLGETMMATQYGQCPDCLGNNKCPLCGEEVEWRSDDHNDWAHCPACGHYERG